VKYTRNKATLATVFILVLSLCLLSIASLFSLVQAAPWTKYTGEAVSLDGELLVVDAWVVKDGTTYKMWYTHSRADMGISQLADSITSILPANIVQHLIALDLQSLLGDLADIGETSAKMDDLWDALLATTNIIGYAESADGIDWDIVNDNVLSGDVNKWENVGTPCVIKEGGSYKMWFTQTDTSLNKATLTGYLNDLNETDMAVVRNAIINLANGTSSAIGYAESTDGIDWGTPQFDVFSADGGNMCESVADPCVINDGGTYKMWYTYARTDLVASDIDDILADIENFSTDNLLYILNNTSSAINYVQSADGITGWSTPDVALSGSNGVWDSVADPCVIYNGSGYEMWYTNFTTNFTEATFTDFIVELQALETEITNLWGSLASGDIDLFLTDLVAFLDGDPEAEPPVDPIITPLLPYLGDTATRIGYAVSADAAIWTIDDPATLVGESGSPWSSVAAPCVVLEDGSYEMWFTQGIDELSAQNIVYLLEGSTLPIGYATFGQEVELVTGWNLIGLPLNPDSSATEDVLAGILDNVVIVWANDATTGNWSSFYYNPLTSQWTGTLTEMTTGGGYWIEMTADNTLVVSGVPTTMPFSIDLVEGWNLVSIPEPTGSSATEDVLSGILDNVVIVWANDATTGNWSSFYYNPLTSQWTGTLTEMTTGKGYWIELTADNALVIN